MRGFVIVVVAILLVATVGFYFTFGAGAQQLPEATSITVTGSNAVTVGKDLELVAKPNSGAEFKSDVTWNLSPRLGGAKNTIATYNFSGPGINVVYAYYSGMASQPFTVTVSALPTGGSTPLAPTASPTNVSVASPTNKPAPTSAPTATSTPVVSRGTQPPAGWEEVDRRLAPGTYNIDHDGQPGYVTLTWDNVVLLSVDSKVVQDLGQCSLRVTRDPNGERVRTSGAWRTFSWITGGIPPQANLDELIAWWKGVLEHQGGACTTYTVSVQDVTNVPHQPVTANQPGNWVEAVQPVFAGDKKLVKNLDLSKNQLALSWFWAASGTNPPSNGCTLHVSTSSEVINFLGGLRIFEWQGSGTPQKDDINQIVKYWIDVLEKEPRGGCAHSGAYTVIWQDASLAPANPNGRP